MTQKQKFVTYEEFGAVGDGVADDLPAVCAAHEHANAQDLPVRTRPDATYHLGYRARTAVIETDTDWGTSRFTIDDSGVEAAVEDHRAPLFVVRSRLEPMELPIERLERDQKRVNVQPPQECHVLVESDARRVYIRRGLNQNQGVPQHDVFILHRDGSIEGDIDWTYDSITRMEARPMDEQPLVIRGGIFTTFANRMEQPEGYNYWARNIEITRSRTTVEGLTHYVAGETAVGHPYRGFLNAHDCAHISFRDCFATGHKIYTTIGRAGLPVSMGSYDLHANNVVNFHMRGCRMNHICDRTRWGVIATNHCKNILLEECTLSRMDTHMGVSGTYTIRGCQLGHMGLKAIGRGLLTVEDSTIYGRELISLRPDYGSTWTGDVVVRNCRWIPACGETHPLHMFHVSNDGMHDFGYPCAMPRTITIDGLFVDDSNHPHGYDGLYLFSDPDDVRRVDGIEMTDPRPYPYAPTQQVTIQGLEIASGKGLRISPNQALAQRIVVR